MSRKPIVRQLPDLDSLFEGFHGFREEENKRSLLEERLRHAIHALRREESRPFYAMREVADFFGVSLKTVAMVFRRLQQDGLLTIMRGSQTRIEGKQKRSRHNIKGVVGIPVPLASFIIGNHPRGFYIQLEEHFRQRGYVADFIFYRADEASHSSLTERLLRHGLDILFWLCPTRTMSDVMLTVQDSGVRVVSVSNRSRHSMPHQYRLDLDCGTREAAAGWKAAGIREILVVSPARSRDTRQMHEPVPAFEAVSIRAHPFHCEPGEFFERAAALVPRADTGFVFVEHEQYEILCNHDWRSMEAFFRQHRCLLTQGPVYHSAFTGRRVEIDTIDYPMEIMAERIPADIAQEKVPAQENPHFFRTRWLPAMNLGEVLREL